MPLALVTGGSRGIGRAIAIRLGRDGFDVVLTYNSRVEDAETVAGELGGTSRAVQLDVAAGEATQKAVDGLIDEHGCPDVLVNNAGVVKDALFPIMKRDSWETVLATNLGSFYSVTRPVVRNMLKHKKPGRIVSIASTTGQRGNAGQVNYAAAKAGLIGATKALAIEMAPRNILINAVAPGFIDTEMMAAVDRDKVLPHIPLGRAGRPEDVAGAVGFLASADAAYITGAVINVNGGLYT